MFELASKGFAVLASAQEEKMYAVAVDDLPVRCVAFYGVADDDTEEGEERDIIAEDGTVAEAHMISRYARLSRTGGYLLARVPGKKVPASIEVKPGTLVWISDVTEKTTGVRFCNHDACVALLGGAHVPDRIDRTGATYCVRREAVPTPTRPARRELHDVEGKWTRHVAYVAQQEAEKAAAESESASA